MRTWVVGAAVLALCSTYTERPASRLEVEVAEVTPQDCRRVEGSQLGALPLEVNVGGATVRFAEWTMEDENATGFVGFAALLPSDVTFTVEAGDDTFTSASSRWLHPAGVSARHIDAIVFCGPSRPVTVASAE
jgi:hypothetical protein